MRAALAFALLASGCVLDSSHVSTELLSVCTDDVPLLFERVAADRSAARVTVDDVGATIDHPDARATLGALSLEVLAGVDDLGFAEAMTLDVEAPGSDLPDARVVDAPVSGVDRLSAQGDDAVDLVRYLTSERLALELELIGPAPGSFALVLDACIEVEGIVVEDEDD
jgi:hypothetical protein